MRAIIFDFDGTVADTLPLIFHCFREVFRKYAGRQLTDKEIVGMFGPHEAGILQENLNPESFTEAVEDFYAEYVSHHEMLVKNDQAIMNLLHHLSEQGIKLGIVTGKGRRSTELSLEFLHLKQIFDVIITGDDVEKPKPHPEGIRLAMQRLGVNASETAYVGDSNADIRAAKAADVISFGVNWLGTSQESRFSAQPDHYVTSTDQFLDIVNGKN
jgi:phosphoglycolate phosphatase/pyrophosphatase PpaX